MNITDDHVYMLGAYIDALSLQYSLSNVRNGSEFVMTFKHKTNQYLDYLEKKMYSIFIEKYGLDEYFVNSQFEKMKKRNKFQKDEFLKEMCEWDG